MFSQAMAMAAFLVALVQLALLPLAFGGGYYPHKSHPQQHQPLPQMHMGMGKEMPHMPYPHYRKDLPMHLNKGKDNKGMSTSIY